MPVLQVQLPAHLHPDLPLIDNEAPATWSQAICSQQGVRATHAPWRPHLPVHSGGILGAATPAPFDQADWEEERSFRSHTSLCVALDNDDRPLFARGGHLHAHADWRGR